MIYVKLVLIVTLCYIFSRGLTASYEIEAKRHKDELELNKKRIKQAYDLMRQEKEMLINTIKELRLELNQYKNKR